ncbi:hypothetical protein ACEPAF_8088 [Sanghuangporus sanghuang]
MSGRLRSTIPHIDQLPCESMRDIFFMTLLGLSGEHPDHPGVETWMDVRLYLNHISQDIFLQPLHISHVSRRWRELSISFDPRVDRAAEHILTALLKEQRQWKDIVLDLKYLEVSSSFSGIRITDTPILSSLTIHTREMLCDIDKTPVYTRFKIGRSTFVRRLDLKGLIKLDAGVGRMTALKDCKLSFCDDPAYVPMCMKILKYLTIDTDADFGHVFESAGLPTVEHDLKILELRLEQRSSCILSRPHLPKLKSLVYEDVLAPVGQEIFSFVERSRPPLTHLHCRGYVLNESVLLDAFRLLPTLANLVLTNTVVSPFFLANLTIGNEATYGSVIFPQLRSLGLDRALATQLCSRGCFVLRC